MSNSMYTTSKVLNEGLMILENELVMGNKVHVDYSSEFGAASGQTINIRRPTAYVGQANNLDISAYNEDIQQGTVPITLDQTLTVPVKITAMERTLTFDRFSEDVIKPAMITMKDKIEAHIGSLYTSFYNFSGTPGTIPSTFLSLGQVGAIMTDAAVPNSDRVAFHGTDASLYLADSLKGVYVSDKAKTAFEMAEIGKYGGFMNYESVHTPTHTVGVNTGTPLVNGASQSVTYAASKQTWSQSLVTKGWTNSVTGILKAGDVFTIAGVFAVNPVTRASTGRLQTFSVLADANSGASTGPATLTISPPIITSGAYQTVTAAPADNAPITVKTGTGGASYKQSLLMHPKAITLVSRALDIPNGQGVSTSTKSGNRVTVSVTEFIDGKTLDQTMRFDMLYKATVIDPRLGARLTS